MATERKQKRYIIIGTNGPCRVAGVRPKSESIAKSGQGNFANHSITRSGSIALTEAAKRLRICRTNL
jgi:hypothetical protein